MLNLLFLVLIILVVYKYITLPKGFYTANVKPQKDCLYCFGTGQSIVTYKDSDKIEFIDCLCTKTVIAF